MSNFDKVFAVIKRECELRKTFAEISCFDRIAKDAGISIEKLPLYLNHLQEIGLIKYSMAEEYIYLTALGYKATSANTANKTMSS